MTEEVIEAAAIPRTPPSAVQEVDVAECAAMVALLRTLEPDEWKLPTDCDRWTVRNMLAHLVGSSQEMGRPWITVRRVVVGRRRHPGMDSLDARNEAQVEDLADRSGPELVAEFDRLVAHRQRARRRIPRFVRRIPMPPGAPSPPGTPFPPGTRMAYLSDVILLRDLWMHRVDVCVATGREMRLADHDREIVAQVVADLARAWEPPAVDLELTGPAGGRWRIGSGPATAVARADTVDYMRCLAGRNDRPDLTVEGDDAAQTRLTAARVLF